MSHWMTVGLRDFQKLPTLHHFLEITWPRFLTNEEAENYAIKMAVAAR